MFDGEIDGIGQPDEREHGGQRKQARDARRRRFAFVLAGGVNCAV
jgi:hypothetical protein